MMIFIDVLLHLKFTIPLRGRQRDCWEVIAYKNRKYGKPYCIVHYLDGAAITGLKNVVSRLGEEQSLNIAGPRESEHPGAYDLCLAILIEALCVSVRWEFRI